LVSTTISMVKASSLASAVGVAELMWQGSAMMLWTYRRVEVYTVVAVVYFALTYPQAVLVNFIHARFLPKG
jgi:polar amino acid transport system permease protein